METQQEASKTINVQEQPLVNDIETTAPGKLRVIKRNGKVVAFEEDKIKVAITKAFLATESGNAAASERIHKKVNQISTGIIEVFERRMPSGGTLHIEEIQDQVELQLMRTEELKVARSYILYRAERTQERKKEAPEIDIANRPEINIKKSDGTLVPLDIDKVAMLINDACEGLEAVSMNEVLEEALKNLYDGVSLADMRTSLVMSARTKVEKEPNYSFVTARILMDQIRSEALGFLGVADEATYDEMENHYPKALNAYIDKGIELDILDPVLKTFDLDKMGAAIDHTRDNQFTYLGLQTLYDRYFIHSDDVRYELPQVFFMRVAMGLAVEEENREDRAIEFYKLLSSFDYMSSTPTLFNSGTKRPQLSSCYLTTIPDDLDGIFGAMKDNALLSKWAGGLGNDWTSVRAMNSYIKGTNGKSQGVVPFLKVANDTAVAVNQGGKRKGAMCAYLETWHLDIEEFLELRKNTGDERRRTHDMNTANWVPDLFMKRVEQGKNWTLFSPGETPELHDLIGKDFEEKYEEYERKAAAGEMDQHKSLPAKELWRKMLTMLFETGHPWITFKDACNLRSPQQHAGVIHSSNLCTEITLNTSADEIAVCNLGSVNLARHMKDGKLDQEKIKQTVSTAIRMLDNVININYYSVETAKNSNLKHRPIGLGMMGFQDALYVQDIAYCSDEAVEFADKSMELISYYAIHASTELSKERGSYKSYEGSLWSKGILPKDSIEILAENRGNEYINIDRSETLDWDTLRKKVIADGMRNSNVMAIAPTATISNITGVTQSVEPTYQNLYVKSNLSGEFTIVNPHLVNKLKDLNLWDDVMINDLKYFEGSLTEISRIPDDIKTIYSTAFEVEPRYIVEAASRRQKWIDQGQSLNLYIGNADGKKLDITYRMAWYSGLKTTYYLRSIAATSTEKSTVQQGKLNAVSSGETEAAPQELGAPAPVPSACSLEEPDCEACQ
ncbi:ribonucleoside-diphosphate reductase subunit alpha [Gammaproteobacteria bacterium]|jgi:ribonucleoside-diphosphate reductase alpha chain|nr:ribonucleoside-diphosphate reductase subunit alpha [Gammaproteobacteria bacterium]MDA8683402.1 ribonucleoside-diphosphate reductase subunit alpha [Gammaproteobacteria bacterium]MDA8857318.1 ribonucleoside-diphosphate reductase subunit alpha [Gammaproteobacteria bacterium]MDA8861434.1 ribonucleoside-diphosphate reductase subunit alpha [Gammaproteobacteria bacterium]MDA8899308.1 ribonucleoside-diphosphate reductase subunit alpha [Gammaproteobacteria bacterium]|tara:strand:+ start:10692 stop:13568 length:2877 start_codon:yes stop_codon:yes gene_type:complete